MNIDLSTISVFLYENITFELFIKFIICYLFIIWFALLAWVIKDIWNRTNSIFLQIVSILIMLIFPPVWIFIYLIIRPWKTLFEKYYLEVEENLELFNEIIKKYQEDKILGIIEPQDINKQNKNKEVKKNP